MKKILFALLLLAAVSTSCSGNKIEPADPPFTYKEYEPSYKYQHNLPLDGCFEVQSVGAVINEGISGNATKDLTFTVNIKSIKDISQKPISPDYTITLQLLDKDNNVLVEINDWSIKQNIIGLKNGETGTVTGSVSGEEEDLKKLLNKVKYVRVCNLCAYYEDEAEKEAYEKEQEAKQESELSSYDSDDDSSTGYSSGSGSEDWDSVLDSYESYVNKYISLMKKANNGDMSAMSEYASMLQEAQELGDKLANAKGELSSAQLSRYMRITNKMTKF